MQTLLPILFVLISANLFGQYFSRLNNSSFNTIENYILAERTAENMTGVSVSIIKNGEIAYLKGYN